MKSTSRRSRMRASPRGKRLELTARDLAVFALLERYRYLRSTYLHAFVGGASQTRFKERLGLLFHEGFIGRPAQQWELAGCRHRPAVYEAAKGSKWALKERGGAPMSSATFLAAEGAHRQFLHSLLICDILASIELTTDKVPGLRFVSWGEILARAPNATRVNSDPSRLSLGHCAGSVVPDGIFGLEYASGGKRSYRFFALEADRGTMPILRTTRQTSISGKLAAYEDAIARGAHQRRWNIPGLLVLIVTNTRIRAQNILDAVAHSPFDRRRYFVAAAEEMGGLERRPCDQVLANLWRRADAGELDFRHA